MKELGLDGSSLGSLVGGAAASVADVPTGDDTSVAIATPKPANNKAPAVKAAKADKAPKPSSGTQSAD